MHLLPIQDFAELACVCQVRSDYRRDRALLLPYRVIYTATTEACALASRCTMVLSSASDKLRSHRIGVHNTPAEVRAFLYR